MAWFSLRVREVPGSIPGAALCCHRSAHTYTKRKQWRIAGWAKKFESIGSDEVAHSQSLRCRSAALCHSHKLMYALLVHTKFKVHQPGIEPGSHRWQRCILPLDHWCDWCLLFVPAALRSIFTHFKFLVIMWIMIFTNVPDASSPVDVLLEILHTWSHSSVG